MTEQKPAAKKQVTNRNKVGTRKRKFCLLLSRSQFFTARCLLMEKGMPSSHSLSCDSEGLCKIGRYSEKEGSLGPIRP